VTRVVIPAATAAIGVAGGVLLGRNASQRNPELFGFRLPNVKIDFSDVGKQIGEAGRQLGKLASEIQAAREKAEKIGKAIS
jgi:hypothetical protein